MSTYDLAAARRAIRAECGKQGIDDEARRAMMQRLAGVGSSTALTADGARAVLDHLRTSGGKTATRRESEWAWVDHAPADRLKRLRYIIVLAGKLGIQRGQQKRYVEGIAENMDSRVRVWKDGKHVGDRSAAVFKPLELCIFDELGNIVQALVLQVARVAKKAEKAAGEVAG